MSDAVNILTHTADVPLTSKQLEDVVKLKQLHFAQDQREFFGIELPVEKNDFVEISKGRKQAKFQKRSGKQRKEAELSELAIEPNNNNSEEVVAGLSDRQPTHSNKAPIVEQLNVIAEYCEEEKIAVSEKIGETIFNVQVGKLDPDKFCGKKGWDSDGIEPRTFVQKVGEAVFIPAGCPNQIRNLKSCINVSLDFVSPENIQDCIRLSGDVRALPSNHNTKEDKLEVKKMIVHAVSQAVNDLEDFFPESDIGKERGERRRGAARLDAK